MIRLLQEAEASETMERKWQLVREANRILSRCKMFRFVTPLLANGVEHIAVWNTANKPRAKVRVQPPDGVHFTITEDEVLLAVAELYVALMIDRLRQCTHCQQWLCARFSHQRFCSARCRERHFQSSLEWKEQRRRRARQYYRLHKTKNVK
jgi:hypothetical protein